MKLVFIYCILMATIFYGVSTQDKRYFERIVAAEKNLQNRIDKQERLIIDGVVPAKINFDSQTDQKERLVVDGIVPAKHDPEDQTKLQSVVRA